ncbi:MAG: ATP-binding protein [Leptolyngbyaceae bacterium]|nr:ATP-binding protein [Leptolyngbyaceae bacterium]
MNTDTIQVLLVEDDPADAHLLQRFLIATTQIELTHVECLEDAIQLLNSSHLDAVLLDLSLPDSRGIDTVRHVHRVSPRTPLLVLTGLDDEETAIAALREGAQDYLVKGEIQRSWLVRAIHYAIERQQTLDKLQQLNRELARSNQELEQFAHIVSHDLQQPLQGILGFAEILDVLYREHREADFLKYINHIIDSGRSMSRLIGDLLEYSTVGAPEPSAGWANCHDAMDRVLGILSPAIHDSNARITMDDLPDEITMQETHLVQVLQNLIGNALKYRHPGRAPNVHISFESKNNQYLFGIHDNGIGISPEYSDQVFQIFKRLHTNLEYSGTGIGLATCKKIVEQYGGQIWVESTPSSGSTFFFTLPIRKAIARYDTVR